MSNKNKSSFLGMPYGTAGGRLRKKLLFSFVQKCDEDVCFKCGDKILEEKDLSIEHKLPWENISVDRFWDLENIAFSHIKCNIPHSYSGEKRRKVGEEGTSWCSTCRDYLPISEFGNNKSRWNGKQIRCKQHHKESVR